MALSLLLPLLCLSQLQLLIAHLPELRELLLLRNPVHFLLLSAFNLQRSRPLDRLLHFKLAPLLLLIQSVGFVFGLSDLLVQNLLLVVFQSPKLLNLLVDHLLTSDELFLFALFNSVDAKLVPDQLLASEFFNAGLLFEFFLAGELCCSDLVCISLHDVGLDRGLFLLALEFANFFAFQVLLDLTLDQLAFKHLFLQSFDVGNLELFELVADGFGVLHLLVVLAFELLTHFLVVLSHFLLFEVFPVLIDLLLDGFLAGFELTLSSLLVHHVREQHLRLERLHHVLTVV